MAREEIKLVGSFKDEITPQLKKLNKEIASIGRTFEKFNKKLAPVTKSFAKMAMSAREFSSAMASQRRSIDGSARAMREYSRQAGKMSGALRKVTDQRMKAQRAMGVSRAQARKQGNMGGGTGPAPGAGSGAAYGAAAAKGFNSGIGAVAIGSTIGNLASQAIMGAARSIGSMMAAPFQKFGAMFAERISDEMDDIKSAGGLYALDMDLTQESGNERFFKNYNESLRFQEKLNIDMAESAAALPGVTSQYVSTSRQLTDTIQMVMEKDRESFTKMAARFGADVSGGGTDAAKNAMQTVLKKQTEQVMLQSMGQQGGLPMHIMLQQLMGKEAKNGKLGIQAFTNRFRAAFQKNPLLKNFLLRAEEDLAKTGAGSVERLQKIMEVFDAAMPKEVVNKMRGSLSGMQEALRSGLLDPQAGLFGMSRANIASAEAIAKGMADESGKLLKRNVNDFGEFLFTLNEDAFNKDIAKSLNLEADKTLKGQELTLEQLKKLNYTVDAQGKIVNAQGKEVATASKSTTYLFEQIREILAGFGPVVLEFVGFLPRLFDPFTKMTESLMPLRDQAQEFVAGFNKNIEVFEKIATEMSSSADAAEAGLGATLKGQSRGRAGIAKVVKFLEGVGGIDKTLAADVLDTVGDVSKAGIEGYDKKITEFIEPLFRSLIESDLAKALAKGFGQIVGGIIRTVFDMVTGIFSLAEGGAANAIVDGFTEGFQSMFADIGLSGMMDKVNEILIKVFAKIGELIITKGIPLIIQGFISAFFAGLKAGPLGMLVSGTILMGAVKAIGFMTTASMNAAKSLQLAATSASQFSKGMLGKGVFGPKSAQFQKGAGLMTKGKNIVKAGEDFFLGGVKSLKGKGLVGNIKNADAMSGGVMRKVAGGFGQTVKTIGPAITKGLASGLKMGAVGGILKAGFGLAEGKSPLDAISEGLASAGGSAIGAAIGTIIAPGIGTVIGGLIGGMLADFQPFVDIFKGTLIGIGEVLTAVMGPVGDAFGQLFGIMGDLLGGILDLIPGLSGAAEGFDTLSFVVNAVKIILWPIVGLVQAIQMGLYALRIALVSVDLFLTKTFTPWRSKRIEKLQNQQAELSKEAAAAHEKNLKYYEPFSAAQKNATKATQEAAAAMAKLQTEAEKAGSTFENNKKFTGSDGKEYGWAMKEGKQVLVEWGSVAGAVKDMVDAATDDIKSPAVENGKVTAGNGMDQETADLINKLRGNGPVETQYSSDFGKVPVKSDAAADADPSGAKAAMSSVEEGMNKLEAASKPAVDGLEKTGKSADDAATKIDTATTSIEAIPPKVEEALLGAATTAGQAITQAATGLAQALTKAAQSIASAASATPKIAGPGAETKYDGKGGKMMPLAAAIQKERQMMPAGANLVIANSSETVIPAYAGHQGDGFKGLSFAELESAAGFDRMKSYTDQIAEVADRTAASFSAGAGMLGGGSATLNAMEALGHSFGLTTTSGHRPGDPGFHGVNRARDLSNGSGETPEMNAAASKMASEFGANLTELIYTPLGFSIKNGQKTGLISPSNHFHHIHVAVAEGLAKAAVFNSERAAMQYERQNMPAGAEPMKVDLSSMTANSSEFSGGGDINIDSINISGVQDPEAIANQVAEEILVAVRRSAYGELYTS